MERADKSSWKIRRSPTNSFLTVLAGCFSFPERMERTPFPEGTFGSEQKGNLRRPPRIPLICENISFWIPWVSLPQCLCSTTIRHHLIFTFCLFPFKPSHLYYVKNTSCFIMSTFLSVRDQDLSWKICIFKKERNCIFKKKIFFFI